MAPVSDIQWILVTGAASELSPEEVEVSSQIGAMLAREGYGLIVGDWDGVDRYVKEAFLEVLPKEMKASSRIRHVANYRRADLFRVPDAEVLEDDGSSPGYNRLAVLAADAGIIVSGRKGSRFLMSCLMPMGIDLFL